MSELVHPYIPIISKSATIALYKCDVGTDIYSAVQYLEEGHEWWGFLTIAFTVCPMILIAPVMSVWACSEGYGCRALLSLICPPIAPVGILYWNLIEAINDCRRGNAGINTSSNSLSDSKSATNNDQITGSSNALGPIDFAPSVPSAGDFVPSAPGPGDFVPSVPGPGDFVPSAPGPGDFVPSAPSTRDFAPSAPLQPGPDTDHISKASNESTSAHAYVITISAPEEIVPMRPTVPNHDNISNASNNRSSDNNSATCKDNISCTSNDIISNASNNSPHDNYSATYKDNKSCTSYDNISNASNNSSPDNKGAMCNDNKSCTSNDNISKAGKDDTPDYILADGFMKIVDSVTESFPQSSLAMHIIFQTMEEHGLDGVAYFQWITLIFSLVSLAWSLATNFYFDDGSSFKGRAAKFLISLLAITCRLMVCSTYSAVHPGLWLVPIGTELTIWIIIACCGLLGYTSVMALASSVYIWYAIGGFYIALPRIITITSLVLNIVMALIQLYITTL